MKIKNNINIKYFFLFLFFCIFSLILLIHKPALYGDGNEYLQMIISFTNHATANLLPEDINERNLFIQGIDPYSGYYKDLNGQFYSYHFWFYSLLCVPVYFFLEIFKIYPLKVFQITNVIFLFFVGYQLLKSPLEKKKKIWLIIGLINPIWLYVPWSHPEVFSFSMLFVGLLKLLEKRQVKATIYTALASLQNPGIALVTLIIGIVELIRIIRVKKIDSKFLFVGLSSLIALFPYLWYWSHYRVFSLIGETYTVGFSLEKTINLFIDPNFGLVIYIPFLILILAILIYKIDKTAIISVCTLFLIGLICSVQLNWNSGATYINRYAVWMIPIVVFGCLSITRSKNFKWFAGLSSITNGVILIVCFLFYTSYSSVQFTPLAKLVIGLVPGLYNPPIEVFVEKSLGREVSLQEVKPITIYAGGEKRKELVQGENGVYKYINYRPFLKMDDLIIMTKYTKGEDINSSDLNMSLSSGFSGLEVWNGRNVRWMDGNSKLVFESDNVNKQAELSFITGSFHKIRNAEMYFNGVKISDSEIPLEETFLKFNVTLQKFNTLEIKATEKVTKASDFPEYPQEPRRLAFYIMNLNILDQN